MRVMLAIAAAFLLGIANGARFREANCWNTSDPAKQKTFQTSQSVARIMYRNFEGNYVSCSGFFVQGNKTTYLVTSHHCLSLDDHFKAPTYEWLQVQANANSCNCDDVNMRKAGYCRSNNPDDTITYTLQNPIPTITTWSGGEFTVFDIGCRPAFTGAVIRQALPVNGEDVWVAHHSFGWSRQISETDGAGGSIKLIDDYKDFDFWRDDEDGYTDFNIDAGISRGASGAPVFGKDNQVIGMISRKFVTNYGVYLGDGSAFQRSTILSFATSQGDLSQRAAWDKGLELWQQFITKSTVCKP